ncbi:MAG: MBL fold metallo-hydrolase [Nitrospirota bacterium]
MTTPQIIRIPILPAGLVNAHLILGPNGCILVDTGLPGSEAKIEKVLTKHGRSFGDITLIVITHAHVDHAGNSVSVRELSGAPIVAHEQDAEYVHRETSMTFCPTGWFGRLFLKTPLMFESYQGFAPDILLSSDTLDLTRYGIPGVVTHTPGHTAGSISVALSTKDALVGDLIASGVLLGGLIRTNHAKRPPFEDDPRAVGFALQRLLDSGMERFYMGHGGPLNAGEVRRHAQVLARIPMSGPALATR